MQQLARKIDRRATIARQSLQTVSGETVYLPDAEQLIHLQFRRFAGCPVCNLHLQSIVRRHAEIAAAGIREVVVFHSQAEELRRHAAELPFAVIADPGKHLYIEFGVESSIRAVLDPRAWGPILRGVADSFLAIIRKQAVAPAVNPHGGRLGCPGRFPHRSWWSRARPKIRHPRLRSMVGRRATRIGGGCPRVSRSSATKSRGCTRITSRPRCDARCGARRLRESQRTSKRTKTDRGLRALTQAVSPVAAWSLAMVASAIFLEACVGYGHTALMLISHGTCDLPVQDRCLRWTVPAV